MSDLFFCGFFLFWVCDHATVVEKVAKMRQMRHDNLANTLRLVVSACSCQSAAEPRDRALA